MKIQCSACEAAEAKVLCCADEAALCWACDHEVHAGNKLLSKHQRVQISSSQTQMPMCDICQETVSFFFCLEDRALLCRKCDLAIHTVNPFVSKHQRFLLTGVKVSVEATGHGPLPSFFKTKSNEKISESEVSPPQRTMPVHVSGGAEEDSSSKLPFAGGSATDNISPWQSGGSATDNISPWQLDEFLGLGDFSQNQYFMNNGSSKVDNGRLEDSDNSSIIRAADGEFDDEEFIGQSPETCWTVPEIRSPVTASGLHCPNTCLDQSDGSAFVPDISSSPVQNFCHRRHGPRLTRLKRRRHS